MKRVIVTILLCRAAALAASAQSTTWSTQVGNTTFYNGAVNGYSMRIGNMTTYNLGGAQTLANRVGDMTTYTGAVNGYSMPAGQLHGLQL